MKINLVFEDWQDGDGESVLYTEDGIELSMGDFHPGTVFDGTIRIDDESEAAALQAALEAGFRPIFYLVP